MIGQNEFVDDADRLLPTVAEMEACGGITRMRAAAQIALGEARWISAIWRTVAIVEFAFLLGILLTRFL